MKDKSTVVLFLTCAAFIGLAAMFALNLWGRSAVAAPIPLVDLKFVDTSPSRMTVADILKKGGDTSEYECNVCHEKNKPIKIKFDADNNIILPREHGDIKLSHGSHKRNNNCYNCHDETNLELLQTRDGRALKLTDSSQLCGSCHGPTYRDWEAGVHGRTSGYWDRVTGAYSRLACPSCHNPHAPKFPSREPAPGPHALHPINNPPHAESERQHE